MTEIVIPTEPTGPEPPEDQGQGNDAGETPEVPEKFLNEDGSVNTEALLKSYTELERQRSQGQSSTDEGEVDEGEGDEGNEGEGDDDEGNDDPAGNSTFSPFFEEFAENGELSEESFVKLEELGINRSMVDQYIKGATADAASFNDEVVSEIGGIETYNEVATWAQEQLANDPTVKDRVDAFNEAMKEGKANVAKLALSALQQAYTQANGKPASRRVTGDARKNGPEGFPSHQQMMDAIQDPRYAKDPAFREEVERRIAASDQSRW